jgi:hypothetical protein
MQKESVTDFSIDDQQLSILDIEQLLRDSYIGFRLKYQQVRWDRYRTWLDPIEDNDISNNITQYDWQSPLLIGRDANNLEHCFLMGEETDLFIKAQENSNSPIQLNLKEKKLVRIGSRYHDIGEGVTTKGDISYEFKTAQDEKEELTALEKAICSKEILGDGPEAKKIAKDIRFMLSPEGIKTTKVGKFFNMVEKVGYFNTAIRTWQKAPESIKRNRLLPTHFQIITNNVLLNSLPELIKNSNLYPRIKIVLLNNKYWINQAFAMKESVMNQYDQPHRIPEYKEKFAAAKSAWYEWTRNPDNAKISY